MDEVALAGGRVIPQAELRWTFARSSGPGGQSVNTTDTAVRLAWDVDATSVLSEEERERLRRRLGRRMNGGSVVVTAREHRSQWANRRVATERLAALVDLALTPPPPERRASRPSRAAREARMSTKRQRGTVKRLRRSPARDD